MAEPPIRWNAEALWEQLVPLLPGLSVEVLPRTTSTNSLLLERSRGAPSRRGDREATEGDVQVRRSVESGAFARRAVDLAPCLLVAEQQTGGRGRQGRDWQSAAGASLTFSLALPVAREDWSGLSLAVGVALCEALEPAPGAAPRIGLKWPNDLWLMDDVRDNVRDGEAGRRSGRKLGGILIESMSTGGPRRAVIGIGLNVLPFASGATSTGFASLQELDVAVTAPAVLATVARPLVLALQRFEREGFAGFAAGFAARDILVGRPVTTTLPTVPEGIARGVAADGALRVEGADGAIAPVASGEVSVRPVSR
ncbi:MAG: biotin--[acetyl-CoA-carboxylase] ligase [Pseudomonadota bacterium]